MKKTLIILLIVSSVNSKVLPYLSPGIILSWNTQKKVSASWKISAGIFKSVDYGKIEGYLLNITYGKRYLLDDASKDYLFTELETGLLSGIVFYGFGAGTAYVKKDDKIRVVPKGSLFAGWFLFLRSDIVRYDHKFDIDIGGNIVLPITELIFADKEKNNL